MPPSRRSSRLSNPATPPAQPRKHTLFDALEHKSRKKSKSSPLDPYLKSSRWIARSEDPFTNFYSVFHAGMKEEGFEEDEDEHEEPQAPVDQARHRHHLHVYSILSKSIGGFNSRIEEFTDRPEELEELCKRMTAAIGSARSDDCGSLKEDGLVYAAMEAGSNSLVPPIPLKSSKAATRGFHHLVLGRLLCPARHLADFDADPAEFLKKLEDGRTPVTALDLPAFLYENGEYDSEDMEKGLLRSSILVRTFRHIFTSPSSAMKTTPGAGCTKSGQAKLNGLGAVTPRTIAYAALHARWFLCAEDDWRLDDGLFIKEEFFNAIVELLETDPDDDWCKDTLAWWNVQVFTTVKPGASADSATAPTSNDISTILAQRCARKTQPTAPQSTNVPANSAPQSTGNAPAANINSGDALAANTLGDAPNVNGFTTTNTRNAGSAQASISRPHPTSTSSSANGLNNPTQTRASPITVPQGAQNLSNLAATNGFTTTNTPNSSGAEDPSAPAPPQRKKRRRH